jgi:hypothetical protein
MRRFLRLSWLDMFCAAIASRDREGTVLSLSIEPTSWQSIPVLAVAHRGGDEVRQSLLAHPRSGI